MSKQNGELYFLVGLTKISEKGNNNILLINIKLFKSFVNLQVIYDF